jgi:hypothetical protein
MNCAKPNRETAFLQRAVLAVAFCVAATGFSGCAGADIAVVPPPQAQVAAAMTVCNKTPDGCSPQPSFSLGVIRDLAIHVDWKNVTPGTRTQKLEMMDPGGGSYQILNTSFVEQDGGNGAASTDVMIPISGSMITQRSITGTWTLRISLDEQMVATQTVTFAP